MHRSVTRLRAPALAFATLLGACDSSNLGPAATGALSVTVTPANGVTPAVVITGPRAYSKTISATSTLAELKVGSYTIVADSVVAPDSVVGSVIYTGHVSPSAVTVSANDTATATVTYAIKERIGGMWLTNFNYGTIAELTAMEMQSSDSLAPADTLATPLNGPAGLAMDASGNMWESSWGDSSSKLLMYTPAQRNAGNGTPSLILRSIAIHDGENLTFDAQGDLWVADCYSALEEFTPEQLAEAGPQTPKVTISTAPVLQCPYALAFDSHGNLWIADFESSHIVEYQAAQLTTGGSPTPADTIGANNGSLEYPRGLAFDTQGNLWVANYSTVVEYTPAQLATGGAPPPNISIAVQGVGINGALFDGRGTLWLTDCRGMVDGVTRAQLAASGTVTPAVTDTVTWNGNFCPEQAVLDPYATATGVGTATVRHPASTTASSAALQPIDTRQLQRTK